MALRVRSEAFDDGGPLPPRYARDGDDDSPPLDWTGMPPRTAELVVTCRDLDATASGAPFVHWLLAGLDPGYDGLGEGEQPDDAVWGRNGFGGLGWGGPQPPAGETHRYVFTVLALARPSGLATGFTVEELERAATDCVLDRGELTARYPG